MNLDRLYQITLKSDKEISGYGQLAQHAIFACHMVRQTPLTALAPLRFPGYGQLLQSLTKTKVDCLCEILPALMWEIILIF